MEPKRLPSKNMGSYLSKTKDGETRFSTSISIETRPVCCSTVKDDSDDSPIVLIAQKALGKIGENSKEACPDSLNSSQEPDPSEELLKN